MVDPKLAIVGARGIGGHGGFETVVSELAPRLKKRGYDVYCGTRFSDGSGSPSAFKGVSLMRFPLRFPKNYALGKAFEVIYDSYFVVKCKLSLNCEAIYCLGVASGLPVALTSWFGSPCAINVDGLEWTRAKFGRLTRLFLRLSFIASCIGACRIVLDNEELMNYVPKRFREKAVCITYGVSRMDCSEDVDSDVVLPRNRAVRLSSGEYWLVVARLEPENNIHTIIEAYNSCGSAKPLVIVGDCSSPKYEEVLSDLVAASDEHRQVILAGSVYDQVLLRALRCRCLAYIHGHSVGGTNPSLLESMSAGNIIIAHDNPFNRRVCSDSAVYFSDAPTLARIMDETGNDPLASKVRRRNAIERAEKYHQWDDVVAEHDRLFREMRLA